MPDPQSALPAEVERWVRERAGAAHVVRVETEPLTGGAVSPAVRRIRVALDTGAGLELVLKTATPAEVAGLRHAQAARDARGVIPELVASGDDFVVLPYAAGEPLGERPLPNDAVTALAGMHAAFVGERPGGVPVVDADWWHALLVDWAVPHVLEHRGSHGPELIERAVRVLQHAAGHPGVGPLLARVPATLLHGDVHGGNVLVGPEGSRLIDWGSSRVGPAMLDLANTPDPDGSVTRLYARARARASAPLEAHEEELGRAWAAVQIPLQYLPWTIAHGPMPAAAEALDRAEAALSALPALDR
ncbi:aminoglycoside phosphotransferase family protein [Microbacterium sp. NEAU-LLC]|uniref:Aminoglycoside phosphotransferase family protein n=1 Tax=Microbacterium helvum TaxID=2773713 RepID=A0ABR8NQK4_9MICO|nr:aminoglycoside phosphotransferase family protein [Microbacterium helvum]MBD3942925.1 aminoglycoside phosphotransferase family protein [Microbacterium helvum]